MVVHVDIIAVDCIEFNLIELVLFVFVSLAMRSLVAFEIRTQTFVSLFA